MAPQPGIPPVIVPTRAPSRYEIREHRIPTPNAGPHPGSGPDGNIWFCENGADQIGRLSTRDHSFAEFPLPSKGAAPVGIIAGADGNLWFTEYAGHRIGRITPDGAITEFTLPTPRAGPNGIARGADGNVWFAETDVDQVGRITPDGVVTEFRAGITPGSRPLAPPRAAVSSGSARHPAAPSRGSRWTERSSSSPRPPPTAARARSFRSGRALLVRADNGQCHRAPRPGRRDRPVPFPRPKPACAASTARRRRLPITENAANLIARMNVDGEVSRRISDSDAERRARGRSWCCPDGRAFFSEYDAGQIGELVPVY